MIGEKMKYANYEFSGKDLNNIGDQIQIITIDYIYSLLGIPESDIVYINKDEMSLYDGEEVILPVSMPLVEYKESGIAGFFSKKITPVFLGLTLAKSNLSEIEIEYYKKYEPIGCRDERTYNTISGYGIKSYLGGCITVLLPERQKNPEKQKKIFVIDPTQGILPYIPSQIKETAIWDTHMLYDLKQSPKQVAKERYQEYFDEAKLVITSLLHCSVPCMAFGIPVILAKDEVSYRFSWLEKLLPIFTPEDYDKVDWNGVSVEYGCFKKKLEKVVIERIQGINNEVGIQEIHDFYMNRNRKKYIIDSFLPLKRYLDENWKDYDKEYEYAVWGLTQMAEYLIDYIKKKYPKAVLKHVYDLRRREKLEGICAESPDNIPKYKSETLFVTSVAAKKYAEDFFEQIAKPKNEYVILEIVV